MEFIPSHIRLRSVHAFKKSGPKVVWVGWVYKGITG